jgi:branched-chain amino acid transport system ATP-binding protein
MSARLQVSDLSGGYPGVDVFSGVTFSVSSSEILAILGANGCGKSALLESLQGVLPVSSGTILLDGEPVHGLPPEARAARGMSLVSDRRRLWKEMTVREHLRVGAFRSAAREGWRSRAQGIRELFPGLTALLGARPTVMSGGLQQQLALARFSMSSPGVWLLDDPLQGLDDTATLAVLDWIRRAARGGAAVVVTGQHVHAMLALATSAMFLDDGTLSEIPVGAEGLRDPRVRGLL